MRSRRTVMGAACGVALLVAGCGAWMVFGPGRLAAAEAAPDVGSAKPSEGRPPFRVAAQGRVEPAYEKFELAAPPTWPRNNRLVGITKLPVIAHPTQGATS